MPLNADKLVGLHIDTNRHKFEPVREGEQEQTLLLLHKTTGLDKIRRRLSSPNCFTAYTYNYPDSCLGETLEDFLSASDAHTSEDVLQRLQQL